MDFDLAGKQAVVCGSTQGIGRAAAEMLAELGATVVVVARDEARLREVRGMLARNAGQRHGYLVADFSDPSGLEQAINQWMADAAPTHILVNNTGGPPAGTALEASLLQYRQAFNAHLICNQILAAALVPQMKQAGYGRIINIISTSVKQPIPGLGVSNTVRGAVASWAKTLSLELGPYGITVNNVLPGFTETGRLSSLIEGKAAASSRTVEQIADAMRQEVPLRRFASPREVAAAVAFFASPAASYISGVSLPVDGGRTPCL